MRHNIFANRMDLTSDHNTLFIFGLLVLCKTLPGISSCPFQDESLVHHDHKVRRDVACDPTSRYRSYDGSCHNLENPTYGLAGSMLRRILPPKYENNDGRTPRLTGLTGAKLPSPRLVSVTIHGPGNHTADDMSLMLMQWGQFLAHEISLTNQITVEGLCCSPELVASGELHPDVMAGGPCFPIVVESDDRYFDNTSSRCIDNRRSTFALDFNLTRQQQNKRPPWIDGSHIYGHNETVAMSLRSFSDGKFKVVNIAGEEFLPENVKPFRNTCFKLEPSEFCFLAGDGRVNTFPGLSLLHTIFLRYHNNLCDRLKMIHSDWSDEILYQEARRIVIAVIQSITYSDFLPIILGEAAEQYDLLLGNYSYNSSIDPTISSVFSTAAFRFGHSLVADSLTINGKVVDTGDLFGRSKFILNSPRELTEAYLRGRSQRVDRWFTTAMTDRLFETPNEPMTGSDIVSRNIQRGRDHGLPPYNDWLEHFGFPKATFESLGQDYERVYASADDVDVYSGAVSETWVNGGIVGQLNSIILGGQFRDLKFGDRFWFENLDDVSSFTADQVSQIAALKLSRVICDTITGINKIQFNAFQPVSSDNCFVECANLTDIDIEHYWA